MTIGNDDHIRAFLADEARRAVAAAPSLDQAVGRLAPRVGGRSTGASRRLVLLVAATLLLVAALATTLVVGSGLVPRPWEKPAVDLGVFEPAAGRIVYYSDSSLWAVDPATPSDPPTRLEMLSEAGIPLGWSSDGTRLLIERDGGLFVLNGDGSETKLTDGLVHAASISPDGSRVVFVGLTRSSGGGCCDYALYAVDANGGPAEKLVEARYIVEHPTFSPDGTQIAYVDGHGDRDHTVWLMDADGSDAHQVLAVDATAAEGLVHGLAWSPAGDRIAISIEGTISTFAPDGSDFTPVISGGDRPYWSPDGSRIAYALSCFEDTPECGFAIADADGSNAEEVGFGVLGPWHPGADSP
ncbi:MAG TPA: LpqB family beta-propeller domain-containing protein [Ilumatobacteraceae bacterium]|nr:LpqB family beta-propeller domain-containing protein [Ilumatobacteraceae bacterium]